MGLADRRDALVPTSPLAAGLLIGAVMAVVIYAWYAVTRPAFAATLLSNPIYWVAVLVVVAGGAFGRWRRNGTETP